MPRSTASFVSYDLRPAKQSERRILIDVLKIGGDCGLPIKDYRYVGMGANRFYDFLLVHKYIGIQNMVSLEHDATMFKRANFNLPFRFISVLQQTAAQFLVADQNDTPTVFWFDYDGGVGGHILRDVASLVGKLKVGDYCFVTVSGGPPRHLDREGAEARLVWIKDNLGELAGDVTVDDVQNATFSSCVYKLLVNAMKSAASVRRDGIFMFLLQVLYNDSQPMVTIGGAFLTEGQAAMYKSRLNSSLAFLSTIPGIVYSIRTFNLTERERVAFDLAATSTKARSSEANQLKTLGFKQDDIKAYKDLVRYLPRYVETIV